MGRAHHAFTGLLNNINNNNNNNNKKHGLHVAQRPHAHARAACW
jgi:hypothetical protein